MSFATQPIALRLLGPSAVALAASTASADFVINDDLIVDGSACIGFDCVNGEVFGFDTLRLKENNTRIQFNDTSVVASYPTNNWQIRANSSTNGGQSYLAIFDQDASGTSESGTLVFAVEANARANSLYVDDGGRIGSRTSTPSVEIHTIDGDTPTLRLQQDGSSGFEPQTWDVAGNETNFFVRDVTNGSTLPLRIRPGAPSNAVFVDVDGDVGMGTSSPDGNLEVADTGTMLALMTSTDNGAVQWRMKSDSGNRRVVALDSADAVETQIVFASDEVQIAGPTNAGADLWAVIDATGITTQGPTCDPGPCDRTFDPAHFEVPSIKEHADFMWENRYLWAVGPTSPDQPYNVTEKTAGMLHELEVAHIYIEQLHDRIEALEAAIAK